MFFFVRVVSILEGLSYIFLLLLFAVPIKYLIGNEVYVKFLGLPHGILFMLYIVMVSTIQLRKISLKKPYSFKYYNLKFTWKASTFCFILLCSLIPFGTFYVDKKHLRKLNS